MPHYRITLRDDDHAEVYWVLADSDEDARRLVALNAEQACEAQNEHRFECEPGNEKQPPFGIIYRRYNGPLAIEVR